MKKIVNSFLLLCLHFFTSCNRDLPDTLPETFQIIPKPKEVTMLNRKGVKYGDINGIKLINVEKLPVMGTNLSQLPLIEGNSKSTLTLELDINNPEAENREGYVLTVSDGNVNIVSSGKAGLFYGCQTLEQFLEDAREYDEIIPAVKITDNPALSYRAVHFDVKHHLDHMDYYYQSIDRLARYKINAVIFEFEDKLGFQRQPLVGAPQSISIEEMAALTKYADERHIEISPLVQGLGHATS